MDESKIESRSLFIDEHLEATGVYSFKNCCERFIQRGGSLRFLELNQPVALFEKGDALYPVCSGGLCRSQSLLQLLKPLQQGLDLLLFAPHASRQGYDPYQGQVQIHRLPKVADDFEAYFGCPRIPQFGFDQAERWRQQGDMKDPEVVSSILGYYNRHYFGPESSVQGKKGKRRVYLVFAGPVHVVLKRLGEANADLSSVVVAAIPLQDEISNPPEYLQVPSGSLPAYEHFLAKLKGIFQL